MIVTVTVKDLFDLCHTEAVELLQSVTYPWEALAEIENFIYKLSASLNSEEYDKMGEYVWVHKTAKVAPTAFLGFPCIIGAGTEVRHCAFIRGAALIGENCVVGNSTELKNVILFDSVQVPHYNYVGDSILGYKAHMGAGAITSNVKSDKTTVTIRTDPPVPTGRKKVGAMVGDYVEIGCNCVLNPGTVIGKYATIYPHSSVRGVIPANNIYKSRDTIVPKIG